MNELETKMKTNINELEVFMFEKCLTYGDRDNVRELIDNLNRALVTIVGNRVIKESRKNG